MIASQISTETRTSRNPKKSELLSAMKENGGGIIPLDAAMDTSLTVNGDDAMLCELASKGHLLFAREDGASVCSLAGNEPGCAR